MKKYPVIYCPNFEFFKDIKEALIDLGLEDKFSREDTMKYNFLYLASNFGNENQDFLRFGCLDWRLDEGLRYVVHTKKEFLDGIRKILSGSDSQFNPSQDKRLI